MSFYIRFIQTSDDDITLTDIESALKLVNLGYAIADEVSLNFEGSLYGLIDITSRGDELFDEEIQELADVVDDATGKQKKRVQALLQIAMRIVSVQVMWQERETEETLERLDPLWHWLTSQHDGLVQVDGEGFFEGDACILQTE